MADKKKYTHVWLGACTGQGGPVLRTGKPFDIADHPWLDIYKAIEQGKAESLTADSQARAAVTGTPKTEFEALGLKGAQPVEVESGKKGKKS